ncbi:MAG: DMT family transporter [Betaproteobacteria bacterium]
MPTTALYAICILIWGTTWYAITAQIDVLAAEVGVTLRFGLAAIVLLAICHARGIRLRFPARVQALLVVQGLTGFGASYVCVYEAERYVASGVVAVGYAASPLFGLVLARAFLGTRMSGRVALGGVVGVIGVVLVFWHQFTSVKASQQVVWGAELTMASVLLASLSTVAAAGYHRLGVKGWGPLAWAMAYGSAGAFAWALVHGAPWAWSWRPAFIGSLAYLALFGSIVAFGAYYALVLRLGPAKAGYIGVLTPVVALVVSSLFESFSWTGLTAAGIALAILGNVVAMWPGPSAQAALPVEAA